MASGHVNRIKRPDTWLHRPMLQNVKKVLANPEPSTHGTKWDNALAVAGPCDRSCLATRTGRADRRLGGGGPVAADGKIPRELDGWRDDRVQRAAWPRIGRGRPAALDARGRAGRDRHTDRFAVRAHGVEDSV